MKNISKKKCLLFVSTGRCGTTRLAEILKKKLPSDRYAVVHQMRYSRLANVIGNILFYWGESEKIKKFLYTQIISKYTNNRIFVSTDPLTSMIIPNELTDNTNCYIIHIQRDHNAFAGSIFALTRKHLKSFIAHNFVPFWQPGILPLENWLNKKIKKKYCGVSEIKNEFFLQKYAGNKNYIQIKMSDIFTSNRLRIIIKQSLNESIQISEEDLKKKSNESS